MRKGLIRDWVSVSVGLALSLFSTFVPITLLAAEQKQEERSSSAPQVGREETDEKENQNSTSVENSVIGRILKQATSLNLGNDSHWRRILYFQSRWLRPDSGLIDDPRFYLAPQGQSDSSEELVATLKGFFSSADFHGPDQHPLCRFPARFRWLDEKLQLSQEETLPKANCPALTEWRQGLDVDRVSLVFSSYYAQSAASMFGHTLLKFRLRENVRDNLALLDIGVNYAALMDSKNFFVYASKGLMGGFKGALTVLPYYIKLQEYNNAESRDLWEYDILLSPAQIAILVDALWEFGKHDSKYFYFDENCSYIPLLLLDVARPDLQLARQLPSWVIPADTIRVAGKTPGLLGEPSFRASNWRQFLRRFETLSADEREVFGKLKRKGGAIQPEEVLEIDRALASQPAEAQARLIDTLVDYVDFTEKLAGSGTPEQFAGLRRELLVRRSKIRVAPASVEVPQPTSEDPRRMHGPVSFGLGVSYNSRDGLMESLYWRPALNEIIQAGPGNPDRLEVRFMEFSTLYQNKTGLFQVDQWSLMRVMTLNPLHPAASAASWSFNLGMETPTRCADFSCRRWMGEGGAGITLGHQSLMAYSMAMAKFGFDTPSANLSSGLTLGPGVDFGVIWEAREDLKFRLNFTGWGLWTAGSFLYEGRTGLELSHWLGGPFELRGRGHWVTDRGAELGLGLRYLF